MERNGSLKKVTNRWFLLLIVIEIKCTGSEILSSLTYTICVLTNVGTPVVTARWRSGTVPSLPKFPCGHGSQFPHSFSTNRCSDFCSCTLVFFTYEFCVSGIIQWFWFLLHNIVFLRFYLCCVYRWFVHFYCYVVFHYKDIPEFFNPFIYWWLLGLFPVLWA